MILDMDIPGIKELATQGVLGILLGISLFFNWFLLQRLLDSQEKRIEDAKQITTKILEPLDTIKANGELLVTLFNKFLNNINTQK